MRQEAWSSPNQRKSFVVSLPRDGGNLPGWLRLWMAGPEITEKGSCPGMILVFFNWRMLAKHMLISTPSCPTGSVTGRSVGRRQALRSMEVA